MTRVRYGRRILLLAALLAPSIPALARAQDAGDAITRPADPAREKAIARALEALRDAQAEDGSWDASFGKATSITSLAVMAYLACGHTPDDPGPYRDTIENGIRFVLRSQKPNGLLIAQSGHGPMYDHGISTLMLAEVVGLAGSGSDEALAADCRAALARAIDLILQAQARDKDASNRGGWRYQPTSGDSDLSVTGWQLLALRAAKSAGCAVAAGPIDDAVDYVRRCAVKNNDGGFAYQPGGGANNPRTGVGILALELCAGHRLPESLAGASYIAKHPPSWSSAYFFYEVYYVPQALFQLGDDAFRPYFDRLAAILVEHQEPNGTWLSADGNDRTGGRSYCTAMAVLALAVEYRYLPIYQR
jgi:hypothetical protein